MSFSPSGKFVLTGAFDGTARIWEIATGKELKRFDGHPRTVTSVLLSPDEASVLTQTSGAVFQWDFATERLIQKFEYEHICSIGFAPDSRMLIGTRDGLVRLFNRSGREVYALQLERSHLEDFAPDLREDILAAIEDYSGVNELRFSASGKWLLMSSADGAARIWNAAMEKEIQRFAGHEFSVECAVFSADEERVATGSADYTARVWNVRTGQEVQRFTGHSDRVESITILGEDVVTGSTDNTARWWDLSSGRERKRFHAPAALTGKAVLSRMER